MKWFDKALAFTIMLLTCAALYVILTYSSAPVKVETKAPDQHLVERVEELEYQVELLTDIILNDKNKKPSK